MILVFSQQFVLFALSTNIIRLLWGAVLVPALSHRSGQFLIGRQHKRFSEGLVQCSKEGLALVQDGVTEDFSMSIWRDKSMENNFGYGGFLHAKALFLISIISTNGKGYLNHLKVRFVKRLYEVSPQIVMRKSGHHLC